MQEILKLYVSKNIKEDDKKNYTSSVHEAIEKAKELYKKGNTYLGIEINVLEGIYYFEKELSFTGLEGMPITIKRHNKDKVIFDGGRTIKSWEEDEVNGVRVLKAFLPEVKLKTWDFMQLFVNSKRCERTRLPNKGTFKGHGVYSALGLERDNTTAFEGTQYIKFEEEDIHDFRNIEDVIVVVDHYWVHERMPIQSVDYENCIITSSCKSRQHIQNGYFLENVFEELKKPGQVYVDKTSGYVYYVPFKGETKDNIEAYAPVLRTLIDVSGSDNANKVYNKHFDGIEIRNSSALIDPLYIAEEILAKGIPYATSAQGENHLPSSIKITYAENISITNCNLYNLGNYAIIVGRACENISISYCDIHDIAGGGIKINGADANESREDITRKVHVTDNHIYNLGQIYKAAVGVFSQNACENVISHNHIHHMKYSAISCGWVWDFTDSVSKDNLIEKNHIHDLGFDELSDMGGIYTLGVQPGTVVKGNIVHDIKSKEYGGWCIYNDGASSHITVENNICYNANCDSYHQNYGRENIVRNNIFISGGDSCAKLTNLREYKPFNFTRNILVTTGVPIYVFYSGIHEKEIIYDVNLIYAFDKEIKILLEETISFEKWKETGNDKLSIIADPKFKDFENYDFTLAEDSPAFDIGFIPIDISDVGVRQKNGGK